MPLQSQLLRFSELVARQRTVLDRVLSDPLVAFFVQDCVFVDRVVLRNVIFHLCHFTVDAALLTESFFAVVYLHLQLWDCHAWFSQAVVFWLFGPSNKDDRAPWLQSVSFFATLKDRSPSLDVPNSIILRFPSPTSVFNLICSVPPLDVAACEQFDLAVQKIMPTSIYWNEEWVPPVRSAETMLELVRSFDAHPPKPAILLERCFANPPSGSMVVRTTCAASIEKKFATEGPKSLSWKRRIAQLSVPEVDPPRKRIPPPPQTTFMTLVEVVDSCIASNITAVSTSDDDLCVESASIRVTVL